MPSQSSFFRRPADAQNENDEPQNTQAEQQIEQYIPRKRTPRSAESEQESEPTRYDEDQRPSRGASSDRGGYGERSDRNDRSSRYPNDRNDRSDRYSGGRDSDRNDRSRGDFSKRPPRGERTDYRKPENKTPRYDEDREAPENVIYGIHPIIEAIQTGKPIEKIYFRRNSSADGARYGQSHSSEALDQIRDMLVGSNIISQDVPPEKLDRLSRRGNHQGVVAVLPEISYLELSDLLDKLSKSEVPPLVVVMDSVTDVRNFGAIARSAECAGADAIIMSAKNSAPVNAEAMRSSAGALNVIPVCRVGSLRNSLKSLQMAGLQLVAATEKADNILFEADLTKPTVIIMGSEDKGISNEVLKMCDAKISIPLLGKIESLNVSAAAAVILFEAVRQRFMAIEE